MNKKQKQGLIVKTFASTENKQESILFSGYLQWKTWSFSSAMRVVFNLKLELYILQFALQYWGRWRAEWREPLNVEWSHIDNMALLCLGRGKITDPPLALLGLGCFLASQKLPAVWWNSACHHLTVHKVFTNSCWLSSVSSDDCKCSHAPLRCNKSTDWQGTMRSPFALTHSHSLSTSGLTEGNLFMPAAELGDLKNQKTWVFIPLYGPKQEVLLLILL